MTGNPCTRHQTHLGKQQLNMLHTTNKIVSTAQFNDSRSDALLTFATIVDCVRGRPELLKFSRAYTAYAGMKGVKGCHMHF